MRASEEGTPQGSILSPLLSNIYLHYVLDLWFSRVVRPRLSRRSLLFSFRRRLCGLFSVPGGGESHFMEALSERLEKFCADLGGREDALHRVRAVCPRATRVVAGRSPRNSPFLASPITVGKPRRATSRSNGAPAARSSGRACVPSVNGRAGTEQTDQGSRCCDRDQGAREGTPELLRHHR